MNMTITWTENDGEIYHTTEYPSLAEALTYAWSRSWRVLHLLRESGGELLRMAVVPHPASHLAPPPVPVLPNLARQILKQLENPHHGLDMGTWHACATTHCLAGWAIHLAGQEGYRLELHYGPELAGMLLFEAAYPTLPPPDLFATKAQALTALHDLADTDTQHKGASHARLQRRI
jgi:hypothetical protein